MDEYTVTTSGIVKNNGKGNYYVGCTGGTGSIDFLINGSYETAIPLTNGDHFVATIPPGQTIRVTVSGGRVRMSALPHHTA